MCQLLPQLLKHSSAGTMDMPLDGHCQLLTGFDGTCSTQQDLFGTCSTQHDVFVSTPAGTLAWVISSKSMHTNQQICTKLLLTLITSLQHNLLVVACPEQALNNLPSFNLWPNLTF